MIIWKTRIIWAGELRINYITLKVLFRKFEKNLENCIFIHGCKSRFLHNQLNSINIVRFGSSKIIIILCKSYPGFICLYYFYEDWCLNNFKKVPKVQNWIILYSPIFILGKDISLLNSFFCCSNQPRYNFSFRWK